MSSVDASTEGATAGSEAGALDQRLDPDRRTYSSFASFSDPDGNGWILQEITTTTPRSVAAGEGEVLHVLVH